MDSRDIELSEILPPTLAASATRRSTSKSTLLPGVFWALRQADLRIRRMRFWRTRPVGWRSARRTDRIAIRGDLHRSHVSGVRDDVVFAIDRRNCVHLPAALLADLSDC